MRFFLPKFFEVTVDPTYRNDFCFLDYVIRMVTMALKSLVIIVHKRILPFKNRVRNDGRLWYFAVTLSELYKNCNDNSGKWRNVCVSQESGI